MKKGLVFLFFSLFVPVAMNAQSLSRDSKPFVLGEILKLDSKPLALERTINVYLPQGYKPDSTDKYPVIYVLDGSAHEDFVHIVGLVQFLNMYDLLPQSIVVGIENVNRYHDFTHPSTSKSDMKSLPVAGGSAEFIQFIQSELIPEIQQRYRVNETSTIIGQSLGGLLATEILMTKPALFSHYLIVSPSLWWGDEKLVDSAKDYFKNHQEISAKVFVSLGKEHPKMHKTAEKLIKAMQESGNSKLISTIDPILTESHATILHKAAYKGLEWLFPVKDKP